MLQGLACAATWRLIEAYGEQGYPFEVYLSWSAGGAGNQKGRVTLSRGGRIGLFAKSVLVVIKNLGDTANKLQVVITDAESCPQTANVWEERGETQVAGPDELEIPPWAQRALLECNDAVDLAASTVSIYDADNVRRTSMAGSDQPPNGIPLGSAYRLTVANAGIYRVIFFLPF